MEVETSVTMAEEKVRPSEKVEGEDAKRESVDIDHETAISGEFLDGVEYETSADVQPRIEVRRRARIVSRN